MSDQRDIHIKTIAALSVASGVAMMIAPGTMSRLYALPRRWARIFGLRDVVIGGLIFGGYERVGLLARSASDALDTALIFKEKGVDVRAIVGAVSSVSALVLATTHDQHDEQRA
jgi:hypothetical protein